MSVALLVLLAALPYEGKYEGDPRMERILAALPAQVAEARADLERMLGAELPEIEVRVEDAGGNVSGSHAESRTSGRRQVVILRAEHLVVGAADARQTLLHEFFHCLHRASLGDRVYAGVPLWLREGLATYVAGQGADRARVLAAHVGSDPIHREPLALLADGLAGTHTWLDYYEDCAAFEAVEQEFGRAHALRLARALLGTADLERAVRETLARGPAEFMRAGEEHARHRLRPLVEQGRPAFLTARQRLDDGRPAEALSALDGAVGVYRTPAAYWRAVALHRLGRGEEALRRLREDLLAGQRARTTLLDRALLLELRLLKELESPEFDEALRRARLDLEPFPGFEELSALAAG